MELKIGDVIQYEYDDWSYVVRAINLDYETDQILYECVGPKGDTRSYPDVWCHTVKDLLEAIEDGRINIIKRGEPNKKLPKFKFT